MAFNAAVQALDELETRWRPVRLEADAPAAGWLVSAERAALGSFAKQLGEVECSSELGSFEMFLGLKVGYKINQNKTCRKNIGSRF